MNDLTRPEVSNDKDLAVTILDCRFNMQKGLWETHPLHWVYGRTLWILVAFPSATALERGVSEFLDDG